MHTFVKARRYVGRDRLFVEAFRAVLILRKGRWTMIELADELGMEWRSAYRLVAALRRAGITVERSREGKAWYYQVPAEPLRRAMRL